ncbi:L,D-transpeptidase family protein [Agarivorans sp. MS3-6]|uniref:L,D-transpeptidase family protein n=1 Tax=Agarivorans sp. TSD2052 TaxID=2937286 RepID=UPI00200D6D97|nr:L,D-transpeptidase family protein [Agarivorans sp. TSD2052]UPW19923.1 L,D-transpeptidase family protein [Agarivorans sp. TSD2052]
MGIFCFSLSAESWPEPAAKSQHKRTIKQVVKTYHNDSLKRLLPLFVAAKVDYPPHKITLLASKRSRRLELWADSGEGPRYIHTYWIRHASGTAGPKLREGDLQVPEGIYQIEALNPNSNFHLSMKLNYPNSFDLKKAKQEQRHRPGSNIFIHGKASSVGCLAMGDQNIEDLFILVERIGPGNSKVVIAPHDPRLLPLFPVPDHLPEWTADLYQQIQGEFEQFIE